MASKKKANSEAAAAAKVAELRAIEARKDLRNRFLVFGVIGIVIAGLIAAVIVVIKDASEQNAVLEAAAGGPIEGVVEDPNQTAGHAEGLDHSGETLPPMGGDHSATPLTCDVYSVPVTIENAIHSLEHGAVWVAYQPELSAEEIEIVEATGVGEDHVFVAPFPGLRSAVVLTGWGVQLELDDAFDERLDVFMAKYVEGPQTPEPGAPCDGISMER